MTKLQLFVLSLGLVLASVLATSALLNRDPTGWQLPELPETQPGPGTGAGAALQPEPPGDATLLAETLYANNLFVPERGPKLEETPKDGEDSEMPADMELTGIGKIGGREAAIIVITTRRRRPGRPAPEAAPKQKIFKVGDEIADTGFTLAKIHFDKNAGICEVELTEPGGETRVLKMETGDKASQARSSQAAKNEVKEATVHVVQAETEPSDVAPPPPPDMGKTPTDDRRPPPTILRGGSPGNNAKNTETKPKSLSQMTREERLKEVLRLRQERMKARTEAGK